MWFPRPLKRTWHWEEISSSLTIVPYRSPSATFCNVRSFAECSRVRAGKGTLFDGKSSPGNELSLRRGWRAGEYDDICKAGDVLLRDASAMLPCCPCCFLGMPLAISPSVRILLVRMIGLLYDVRR